MSPFWYDLIMYQTEIGENKNGPTIPYILGAQKIAEEISVIDNNSISELLLEIADSETESKAVLQKCPGIEQYVIGLRDMELNGIFYEKDLSFINRNGEKSLYVFPNATSLGTTIEEIGNSLTDHFEDCLKREKFSWDFANEEWREFSPEEKEIIKTFINQRNG
jgi:hypothetical protein